MRNEKGHFVAGIPADNQCPVGTVRIRTRYKRNGEQRAFIKIADPNTWVLRSRFVWEQAHGLIPRGFGIHHKDRNKLNDDLDNLELVSKSEHLDMHRPEFIERTTASLNAARKERRWSTKSKTKRTGRPPTWTDNQLTQALDAYRAGEGTQSAIEQKFNLPRGAISKRHR